MLLKEITLKNFRQYKGEQNIKFSTDPDKNVTVLLGDNTGGKTTFVQAFRWVLYEDSNFTGKSTEKNPINIINMDVRKNSREGDEAEAFVKLNLEHNGIEYELVRRAEYVSEISGDLSFVAQTSNISYYDQNGNRSNKSNFVDKVEEILPHDLSEYFFFDGEKIANSTKKNNVEEAINSVMGLTVIKNIYNHLVKSSISVYSQLRESLSSPRKDGASIQQTIKRLETDKHQKEETIADNEKKISTAVDQLNEAMVKFNEGK